MGNAPRYPGDPNWNRPRQTAGIMVWVSNRLRALEPFLEWLYDNLLSCCCAGESACVTNKEVTLRHEDEVLVEGDNCSNLSFELEEGWAYNFDANIMVIDSATGNMMREQVKFEITRAAGGNASFNQNIYKFGSGARFAANTNTTFVLLDESSGDVQFKIYIDTATQTLRFKLAATVADVYAQNSNIRLVVSGLCFPEEGDIQGY